MALFNMSFNNDTLTIGFGDPATNAELVQFVKDNAPEIKGIPLLKVNGPASLPVAAVLIHKYAHTVGSIAVFDPKLGGYVVSVSHNPEYKVGDVIK